MFFRRDGFYAFFIYISSNQSVRIEKAMQTVVVVVIGQELYPLGTKVLIVLCQSESQT